MTDKSQVERPFLNFRNCPFPFRGERIAPGALEIFPKKVHFARFIWHFRANGLALRGPKGRKKGSVAALSPVPSVLIESEAANRPFPMPEQEG